MESTKRRTKRRDRDGGKRLGLMGAILGAVAASLCCIGPLVLLTLGIGGAWAGTLSALEPYRPFFTGFTVLALVFAFYRVYRRPKEEHCEPGSYCANPRSGKYNKSALWVVTVLAVGLLAAPWLLGLGGGKDGRAVAHTGLRAARTATATLALRKMTCNGCVVTVTKALNQASGVVKIVVTLNPPRAVVTYDPTKTTVAALIAVTTSAGYPSSEVRRQATSESLGAKR